MCRFTQPLAIGDVEAVDPTPGYPVSGSLRLDFGNTQITASAAITVDSTSIIYAGYTNSSGKFVGAVRIKLEMLEIISDSFVFFSSTSSSISLPSQIRLAQQKHSIPTICHLL